MIPPPTSVPATTAPPGSGSPKASTAPQSLPRRTDSLPPAAEAHPPKPDSLPPSSATQSGKSVPPPKVEEDSAWSAVFGGAFWLAIVAVIAYLVLRPNEAKILLEVSHRDQLVVEGAVTYQGAPIDGKVELVLDDRKTGRHLGSVLLDTKKGNFSSQGKPLSEVKRNTELRIHASFIGSFSNDEHKPKEVTANQTVYTNCPPPFSDRSLAIGFGVVGAVSIALLFLFTGNYTRRSAAFLFGSAYLFTFLSVVLPIIGLLYLAQNHYVIGVMKLSPIGIVIGRTNAVASPQWLLNLGGVVVEQAEGEPPKAPAVAKPEKKSDDAEVRPDEVASGKPAPAPAVSPLAKASAAPAGPVAPANPAGSASPATNAVAPARFGSPGEAASAEGAAKLERVSSVSPAASEPPPVLAKPLDAAAPLSPPLAAGATGQAPAPAAGFPVVYGGLAIPFYVIILAVFGAGINMMRRVPQIQSDHIPKLPDAPHKKSVLKIPFTSSASPETPEQIAASCKIRKEVIEQYMFLMSAPFLAIAVYYLLQIVASNISEPVLVLMAFSAGLVSESIVTAIIQFAEGTIAQIGKSGADARRKVAEEQKREEAEKAAAVSP